MNWKRLSCLVTSSSLIVIAMAGCGEVTESTASSQQPATTAQQFSSASQQTTRPEGWSDETHGDDAVPNYEVVFPQDKVNQLKITIASDDWEAMQTNMAELFGAQGTGQRGGAPGDVPQLGGAAPVPAEVSQRDGGIPDAGVLPAGAGGDMTSENPMWVPATIEFNGLTWTNVGVRYKGGSSLTSGWRSGTLKLPLKLDFDEFEDEYPEIDDQRFYGFKQLSLSNAFKDGTFMRDAIAADLLAESGLVAAETAYYEVIIDYGEGPVDLGLYVMIEVIDDTVIDRFFSDDSGNIYEGEGPGTSLALGTFGLIEDSFVKENNEEEADWSDIEALYNVIHSEERTSDPEAWRENLESVFDVDAFLEWLAISAVVQHWDSYGSMPHNFYLYHDPDTDLLTWISWDHNEILRSGGETGGRGGMRTSISLGRDEVGQNWPLIRYLLDDPVYYDRYIGYIEETITGAFNPDEMKEKCQELADLIAPYAANESGEVAFKSAVQELINTIYERYQAAAAFLAAGG